MRPEATRLLAAALGGLLLLVTSLAGAAPPPMSRDDIICRAASAVGFSYYWGGSCWCANGCSPNYGCSKGSCSGSCPSCTHTGTYGADCSGLTNKVWQVPSAIGVSTCGHGPYTASSYTSSTSNWSVIPRSSAQRGDAFASSTHVLIYESGDPWGSMVAYEARGCSYGIVHNSRTCSSSYSVARRANLVSPCDCSPGQTETASCGNCGTRSRTCGSSCKWGSWSACQGQGVCSPGATETEPCCDCGAKSRSCNSECAWDGWSSCAGPDPVGDDLGCDTGRPGPCAVGTTRCVEGCLACESDYEPVDELCDGIDNDCSGAVDDGGPTEMGEVAPAFAARLIDASYPSQLEPGELGYAWATFVNEGSEPWPLGSVWLAAVPPADQAHSALFDSDSWPAWDVAAVVDGDIAPGEHATFAWTLMAPDRDDDLVERFHLEDPQGELMACPAPEVSISLRIGDGRPDPAGKTDSDVAGLEGLIGCSSRGGMPGSGTSLLLLFGVWLVAARRRRPSPGSPG